MLVGGLRTIHATHNHDFGEEHGNDCGSGKSLVKLELFHCSLPLWKLLSPKMSR